MIRKDVVIAVLTTFCLTLTLFSAIRAGGYDPWSDINDDGTINMKDIANVASQFNTVGDPTKNVTVKDNSFTWFSGIQNVAPGQIWSSSILNTVGFRQVTIKAVADTTVSVHSIQSLEAGSSSIEIEGDTHCGSFTRTYDVKGTSFSFLVHNNGNTAATVSCWVYLNSIPSPNMNEGYDDTQHAIVKFSRSPALEDPAYMNIYSSGFSRMSFSLDSSGDPSASAGDYEVILRPCVSWGGSSVEYFSANDFNVTFHALNGTLSADYHPFIIETKGAYCLLWWSIVKSTNLPLDWWITFEVSVYLRND